MRVDMGLAEELEVPGSEASPQSLKTTTPSQMTGLVLDHSFPFWRQDFMQPWLTSNSSSSCLGFPSTAVVHQ